MMKHLVIVHGTLEPAPRPDPKRTESLLLVAGSKLANSYGGQTTPHAFLLDSQRRLVYKGAIDDNYDDASKVKHSYVKDAIAALSAGKAIAVTETKPVGCSIKRAPAN